LPSSHYTWHLRHCRHAPCTAQKPTVSCMPSQRAPPAAHATRCKVVVRKPGDFWGFFPAAQLRCAARGCGRRARKRHGVASTLQHPRRARRARSRAASAREGSRKIRATRRAQDQRSPLTVKRTRARAVPTPQRAIAAGGMGSRSGLRGTGARNGPAKVFDPTPPFSVCTSLLDGHSQSHKGTEVGLLVGYGFQG
jgi:hypothetical protein